LYMPIFSRIFLSNYWWQKSDIWSQASYRYPISWEAFLDPSDSYFLFAEERGYHKWALAHSSSCYIYIYLNKNWKIYWSEQCFTGLGPLIVRTDMMFWSLCTCTIIQGNFFVYLYWSVYSIIWHETLWKGRYAWIFLLHITEETFR
jgi:hypothetical protein